MNTPRGTNVLNNLATVRSRFNMMWLLIPAGALLALIVVMGSWYQVDQGERGVHLRNGAVIGSAEPGLGFKLPIFDDIKRISVQNLTNVYDKVQAYSKDQQTAEIRVSVSYHVPPADVVLLYSEYGSVEALTSRLVDRQVPTQVENVFGQYTAVSAVQNRVQLVKDINQAIREAVKGPVVIDSVQVENIDFSEAYEQSVEQRMLAQVQIQQREQNLRTTEVEAQIARTRAEGEANAIRLRGDAEASAIRARADALRANADLVQLQAVEKWDGKLPTTMIPGSALPFVNLQTTK
jgi:regulator of protease activity HflC (stomatin/prohibitin superfamily)